MRQNRPFRDTVVLVAVVILLFFICKIVLARLK